MTSVRSQVILGLGTTLLVAHLSAAYPSQNYYPVSEEDPYLIWFNRFYDHPGGRYPRQGGEEWDASTLTAETAAVGDEKWEPVEDCWTLTNDKVRSPPTSPRRRPFESRGPSVNSGSCGLVDGDRIVGGVAPREGTYPFNVALRLAWGLQMCGGSLVNDRYVLTAAHCVAWGRSALNIRLTLGAYKESDKGIVRRVKALKYHIKYDLSNPSSDYDVALIEMDEPVPVDSGLLSRVSPICLAENPEESFAGHPATVIGWGVTAYNGHAAGELRHVNVTVLPNEDCTRAYGDEVTSNMVCAGEKLDGKDACQGDSGGPLAVKDKFGRWVQVGIVSWGRVCGLAKYPGVYGRVSHFYDWIRRHSK